MPFEASPGVTADRVNGGDTSRQICAYKPLPGCHQQLFVTGDAP
jgi:hypothetical protein